VNGKDVYSILGGDLKNIDKGRMSERIYRYPEDLVDALRLYGGIEVSVNNDDVDKVVIAGMGGSAIGGIFLQDLFFDQLEVPIILVREMSLPRFVDEKSLVLAVSYSGNTEETLRVFSSAVKSRAHIISVTSDGIMSEVSGRLGIPTVKLPGGLQPRASFPYMSVALISILQKAGLVDEKILGEIESCARHLREKRDVMFECAVRGELRGLVDEIVGGKIPIVYSYRPYISPGYRFRTQLNENAKIHAFYGDFPEVNHNEIMGWDKESAKEFVTVFLRGSEEKDYIKYRIEFLEEFWSQLGLKSYKIRVEGSSKLCELYELFFTVDVISVVVALTQGVDPTPVDTISLLKRYLGKRIDTRAIIKNL